MLLGDLSFFDLRLRVCIPSFFNVNGRLTYVKLNISQSAMYEKRKTLPRVIYNKDHKHYKHFLHWHFVSIKLCPLYNNSRIDYLNDGELPTKKKEVE